MRLKPYQTPGRAASRKSWLFATTAIMVSLLGACEAEDDDGVPPAVQEGCVLSGCHAKVEQIHHGGPPLRCVDCHLGDPGATTKAAAHITTEISFNPSTPGSRFIDDPPMDEIDALPLDVIQFLNPADYRVVRRTCGSALLGGSDCHTRISDTSQLLNRSTLAGTLAGGGFIAGLQDKTARYGVVAIEDPYLPDVLHPGQVPKMARLPAEVPDSVTDPVARAFFPIYEQLCVECHVYRDGPRIPGRYYSSGCNACHMVTSNDARAATKDPTQDRSELGHVRTHRFTNLIPDSQCAHCHISHLARALLSRGVRERSEPEGDTSIGGPNRGVEDPEHVVPWAKKNYVKHKGMLRIYGKPYPFYIEDEDGTNEVDETPPDIHTEKGMACIDCHNIREAHGDAVMADRMDREIDVRCQSCHGRPGDLATLASDAGLSFTRAGTAPGVRAENPGVFVKKGDGTIQQRDKLQGLLHPVTQITRRTDPGAERYNPRTRLGCELHAGSAAARAALKKAVNALVKADPGAAAKAFPGLAPGFTFEIPAQERDGRVECFTCHNQWTLNCYGCHMVRDDREPYTSRLDGKKRFGRVSTFGMSVVSDALALGFNARARISPLVGTSIFFTHIDAEGKRVVDAAPLTTGEGLTGEGNVHNPVHHHTVRKLPRDCDGCHPSATGSHDPDALLRVVGLGTGAFTFTDGEGRIHWLDRLIRGDYDGDGQPDDPSVLGLPEELFSVERVVGTTHVTVLAPDLGLPDPGPLDLETVNLILKSPVVPQRPKKEPRKEATP